MLEVVKSVNGVVNGFIWGIPAMICIIGIGLYLSYIDLFITTSAENRRLST